jgi:hypothetical protein
VADAPGPDAAASDARARSLAALFVQDPQRLDHALRTLPTGAHDVEIPIRGASMGTTLPDGCVARVTLDPPGAVGVGEVVVFRQGGQLVAHRVVYSGRRGRAAGHLLTRGDARLVPDPPVSLSRLLGRVTARRDADELAPLAPVRRPRWPVRWARGAALGGTVLLLHASPALAAWLGAPLTAIERSPLPLAAWRLAQRARLGWLAPSAGSTLPAGDRRAPSGR